jgi:enoyl-CoA hydratase
MAWDFETDPAFQQKLDRLSAIGQWALDWDQATAAEIALGMEVLRSGASREGAARFAAGEGRGGKF